ncbi:hypothetical protein VPNG_03070 [Cytospora leucostoma]|uniref:Uncharacterized protein n=1 Tax=Cytospora leucostoma TaxID=1230097 RepID=A0A423XG72_9PEZI|nr:hypothetical protein VPNG_03070 [Cytospora leucostoma]
MNTILIIGATTGIGEAFARRFHGLGKKVIITGRNQEKLKNLAQELPGLETRQVSQLHVDDLPNLGSNINKILADFPSIDSVIINAGIQQSFNLLDPSTISPDAIASEITTNLTGPTILVHHLAPHLLKLAQAGTKTNLFLNSSTLAYIPLGSFPSYIASKAGIAALARVLRQQLISTPGPASGNMAVVEIVPPWTDTGLDKNHRDVAIGDEGGADNGFAPMPLGEYVDKFFDAWEGAVRADGSVKEEIGVGLGAVGVDTWRASFGELYKGMGLST